MLLAIINVKIYFSSIEKMSFLWVLLIKKKKTTKKKKTNRKPKTKQQPNQQKTSLKNTWTDERAEWKENQSFGNKILYSENKDK